MKIALAQMRVVPGSLSRNLRSMTRLVAEARDSGCDLVAFPELCVSGYLIGDRWLDRAFCLDLMAANDELQSLSAGIVLVYGNLHYDESRRNKDGRARAYNAAYAFQDGTPLPRTRSVPGYPEGIAIKTLLPNYRFFDDERYFFSLRNLADELGRPLEDLLLPLVAKAPEGEVAIGLEVCEDLWFSDYFHNHKPLNVSGFLCNAGADLIVNISASPWTAGKADARNRRIKDARTQNDNRFVPFYYVNCVGTQNNGKNFITFDGDSAVYDHNAERVAWAGEPWKEELVVHHDASVHDAPVPKSPIEEKFLALLEAIRSVDDFMGSGFPWVVGVSGGIDSAVVACLVERAVGKHRLVCCNLPSRYNGTTTIGIAGKLAAELGVALHSISIEGLVEANGAALKDFTLSQLNEENIQAKIRGTSILSNVAASLGGVMTNNGNKVEVALGYATLYGDVNGAIAPIGDVLKTEVFELGRYLNEVIYGREVISAQLFPDELFRFAVPPSAELRAAQVDPMKWGYHDALLEAMTGYRKASAHTILEHFADRTLCEYLGISNALLDRYGLNDPRVFVDDLEWFDRALRRAVFKRIQAPPIVVMSRGSFGFDVRESQLPLEHSDAYVALREKVLESAS